MTSARLRSLPARFLPVRSLSVSASVVMSGAALATVLSLGCPADPRDQQAPDTVAVIGEHALDRLTVLKALTWAGVARNSEPSVRAAQAREILDSLIKDQLLLELARRDGVTVSDDDIDRALTRAADGYTRGSFERMLHAEQMTAATYRERLTQQLVIEALLSLRMQASRQVSDAEMQERYQQRYQKQLLAKPQAPQVRARQVLVKTEEEAEHIIGELNARRLTLEDAARRYSAAPEGKDGGLLPWFARGELPTVFDRCFDLEDGKNSGVIPSNYGFHIFEVVARRPGGALSFAAERTRLEREIRREKERAATVALVATLRTEIDVRVDEAALAAVVQMLPATPVEEKSVGPDPHLDRPEAEAGAPKFPVRNKPVPRRQPRPSTGEATP